MWALPVSSLHSEHLGWWPLILDQINLKRLWFWVHAQSNRHHVYQVCMRDWRWGATLFFSPNSISVIATHCWTEGSIAFSEFSTGEKYNSRAREFFLRVSSESSLITSLYRRYRTTLLLDWSSKLAHHCLVRKNILKLKLSTIEVWQTYSNIVKSLMLSSIRKDGKIHHETAIFRPYRWKTAYLGAIFCLQSLVCGISGRVDSMCYLHSIILAVDRWSCC